MANGMKRNVRALQLEIRLITGYDGKVKVDTTLKHRCKDKQSAIELIKVYVDKNTRESKIDESRRA